LFYRGELTKAQVILEQGSAFYDPQAHSSLTMIYGQDPGVGCRSFASLALWFLGYPDQALGKSHDALSWARELSHSYSVGAALHAATWVRQYRQEREAVQAHAKEELVLSKEEGFALWLAVGTIQRGWALSEQGEKEQGIAQLREGMAILNATGAQLSQPYHLALLAQAHGKSGQSQEGLVLLDQALATVEKTGERHYEPELYRLKGELLLTQEIKRQEAKIKRQKSQTPNPQSPFPNLQSEAEACFLKALDIARRQQAKSPELRAAMSLSRLRQQQATYAARRRQYVSHDRLAEAHKVLSEIYDWFTEGFDTRDLQDAKALLEELRD
jgi:predicted ATPase